MIYRKSCLKNNVSLLILFVMIFELCLFSFNTISVEAAQSKGEIAVATLRSDYTMSGFAEVEVGDVSGAVNTVKADRQAWLMDKSMGNQKSKIGFSLSPEFKHTKKDGSVYELEIDYYDSGNGYFQVYYDAYTEAKKSADIIYTNKENCWKTASFTLDDASFTNRVDDKYDFTITINARSVQTPISPESIAVGEVRVKRFAAKNPIYVTSNIDETGNAFKWFSDSKIIHNKFENLTDGEKTVTVKYIAESIKNVKILEKTETITLNAGETKNVEIDIGEVKRCDIYKYSVEIYSDDGQINSVFQPFEFSIIKTDPNGIKNADVYLCTQMHRYPAAQREMGVEMLDNSNSYGGRGTWSWNYYFEKEKGVFSTNFGAGYVAELYKKKNLNYMAILTGGNQLYGMASESDYPDTAEELEAFRRYVSETAKALNGVTDHIEVLNEPNLASFNVHMKKGAEYAAKIYVDCLKAAYEEIKKVNPDIKVAGPVLCYIHDERGRDFFNAAMDLEMWKYIDALDLHPYGSDYVERCGLEASIQWFKDEFAKVGRPDIEIWHSEIGFSTADARIANNYRQGYLNAASSIFYKAKGMGDKIALYVLEQCGTIDTDREDRFGLVSPGYADASKYGKWFVPTEGYLEVTAMNYYMAESEIIDSYYIDDSISVNYFKSNKFGKNLVAIYSMDGAKNLSLDLGAKAVIFADEYGNETELNSENGIYTVSVGNAPVYILGDITKTDALQENVGAVVNSLEAAAISNDSFQIELTTDKDNEYEILVEAPDCAKVINEPKFVDNKCSVTISNSAQVGDEYDIIIKVKSNNNIFQITTVNVKTLEAASVDLTANLLSSNNLNQWEAVFKIKNNSLNNLLKGKIRITSPEMLKTNYFDIGNIPPTTTGRVRVKLPQIRKKGEYLLNYELVSGNDELYTASSKIDFTIATYAEKKPIIDGVIDKNEWNTDLFMYAENDYQIKLIKDWRGKSDLSAKSLVEWDEDNLYLAVEVTDDVFCQPEPAETSWKGDSVQFGFFYGDEVYVAMGQKNTTFHEICLSLTSDGPRAYRYLSTDNCYEPGDITKDCELAVEKTNGKVYYEFKIPWEKLLAPGQRPVENSKLGFSFLVNDNDGDGRRGWIEYAGGIGEAKNSELFTYLTLIK